MGDNSEQPSTESSIIKTGGYCKKCGVSHWLGPGSTLRLCRELMDKLGSLGTIDLHRTQPKASPALATASLFGPARGKMFGVMECLQQNGTIAILYAFSGQYNGLWLADGWAPPLFGVDDFLALTVDREKRIKQLGRKIDRHAPYSSEWLTERKRRRQLSRELMRDIHNLYRLTNFRGETATLEEVFVAGNGIPTGTGDCCAPKLLNFAAQNNMRPIGISEFFWGKENKSGGHRHGSFASSCMEKCEPILGFMLCGLEEYPMPGAG
ncbi:MAG: hypothetical protein WBB19_00570 [Desulforhopalus sp.]